MSYVRLDLEVQPNGNYLVPKILGELDGPQIMVIFDTNTCNALDQKMDQVIMVIPRTLCFTLRNTYYFCTSNKRLGSIS